ncbi:hypothetical protein E2C01_060326 [Portunus trituberculatus]|uniref:Uncharacterized protein n=1 Tax=Portunus trituberculatus TaxID=210409 RepID=A0A5B7H261_PORTR|nr:hypothetical protein [Portunus trituberculatus]
MTTKLHRLARCEVNDECTSQSWPGVLCVPTRCTAGISNKPPLMFRILNNPAFSFRVLTLEKCIACNGNVLQITVSTIIVSNFSFFNG